MNTKEVITLRRDCEAIMIPSGEPMMLSAGMKVRITQSLGGTYTVTTDHGYMVRIAAKDIDALGMEAAASETIEASGPRGPAELEKIIWEQMRTVFDPEIPVNVVDLGLVYSCKVTPLSEGGNKAEVTMTLTAPGCGMGGVLQMDAESKIRSLPGIKEVDVQVVIDPPWNPGMMSEAAKLELGML
jgi:probable FeS assembly SUF system protein SufT